MSSNEPSNTMSRKLKCHSPTILQFSFIALVMFCILPSSGSFVYQIPSTSSAMDIKLISITHKKSVRIKSRVRRNTMLVIPPYCTYPSQSPFQMAAVTSSTETPSASSPILESKEIACSSASDSIDENKRQHDEIVSPEENFDESNGSESYDGTSTSITEEVSKDEETQKEKIKSMIARNLLYKNDKSQRGTSNTKKGRTQTSVGPLKGRSRSARGKGTLGGSLLSTVRKNASIAASVAEKERKQQKQDKEKDVDASALPEQEPLDPLQLKKSSTPQSFKETSIPNVNSSEETKESNMKVTLSDNVKDNPTKSTGIFQTTINRILHNQEESRQRHQMFVDHPDTKKAPEDAGTRPASKGIGLFGESSGPQLPEPMRKPFPGTILSYPSCHFLNPSSSSFKKWKKTKTHEDSEDKNKDSNTTPIQDAVTVRVATRLDDHRIANLRLSVFANYNSLQNSSASSPPTEEQMEQLRNRFRIRSCQVLESRRNLGAICLIASVPKVFKNEFVAYSRNKQRGWRHLSSSMLSNDRMLEFWQSLKDWEREEEWVMGSVECSIHEFYGTSLGKQRVKNGILYITEVAVSPDARMIGVGNKLLQGVDKLAHIRNVETLYLHVDVTNEAAIGLYTKAGYKQVEPNPVHMSFTRSLNLHDGATNGRNHYLFYKHLRKPTILTEDFVWYDEDPDDKSKPKQQIGFEMPR